jgi:hypothetical protein
VRAESFLYLNALEIQLENYDAAMVYLQDYHTQALKLYEMALHENARIEERHNKMIIGLGCVVFLSVVCMLFFMRRKFALFRKVLTPGQSLDESPRVDISDWERYLADVARFRATAIYSEIAGLAGQSPGRKARVLSLSRQNALDRELAVVFAHFSVRLQREYPSLTPGDIKLCCLSLAGLSSWGRALCFGSTETNIIRQRKHNIKQKLNPALFEFIFSSCSPVQVPGHPV